MINLFIITIKMIKVCISLVVTVFLVQFSATYTLTGNENALEGSIQDAVKALKKLEDVIKLNANKAVSAIEISGGKYDNYSKMKYDEAKSRIENSFESLGHILNDIKNDAMQKGIDISDCTEGREEEFEGLSSIYVKQMDVCSGDLNGQLKAVINDSFNRIQSTFKILEELTQVVNECMKSTDSSSCIDEAIVKINEATDHVPGQIGGCVAAVFKRIVVLEPKVVMCVIGCARDYSEKGQDIINNIAECAKNKE